MPIVSKRGRCAHPAPPWRAQSNDRSRKVSNALFALHAASCELEKPPCYINNKTEDHVLAAHNETDSLRDVARLGDEELIATLRHLLAKERRLSARLLVHLAEVDARGLYRQHAYSSMFDYCVHAFTCPKQRPTCASALLGSAEGSHRCCR